MNFLPVSLGAVLLAAAIQPQNPPAGGPPQRPGAEVSRPPAAQQLFGAWRLTAFESPYLQRERREQVGYLLVQDGFLSFECHIGWKGDGGNIDGRTFFSGTHTFKMRSDGVLELASLIGATVDPGGSTPVFEPVGRRREYKARFVGSSLELVRQQDQQKFTFERLARGATDLDFYGRRRQPDPPAGEGPK
ncbi:MAG: hypothetical protein JNK02_09875 [Planctomycetes bacterium]|nr:hypothetical protein [Planctomycetota bacterium]